MNLEDFKATSSGTAVRTIGGYVAFVANPLPPKLDLGALALQLAEAQHFLGELAGIGRTLSNPYLLQKPFARREAVSSSSIEGTRTTLSELLVYEASGEKEKGSQSDAREVHNYVRALEYAFDKLHELPPCGRLFKETHSILMRGISRDRGAVKRPGVFRTQDPAWTGAKMVEEARFVFSPPEMVEGHMAQLEDFMADPNTGIPHLIKAGLVHYQLETIHPFYDGNGRIGRLAIPLYLSYAGLLQQPLLFISPYFARFREEYVERLYEVSRYGRWEEWISFFLKAVSEQSQDMIYRSSKLLELQKIYREKFQKARSSALLLKLVDMIFEQPVISIPRAQEYLDVTYNSARKNLDKLLEVGFVTQIDDEHTPKLFIAQEVFKTIHSDLDVIRKKSTVPEQGVLPLK